MKSIALCPVYDMLSFYFIGLLHKIEKDCKHSILTVCLLLITAGPFIVLTQGLKRMGEETLIVLSLLLISASLCYLVRFFFLLLVVEDLHSP